MAEYIKKIDLVGGFLTGVINLDECRIRKDKEQYQETWVLRLNREEPVQLRVRRMKILDLMKHPESVRRNKACIKYLGE